MRRAHVPDCLLHRPFTTAQARAAGVTKSALRGDEYRSVLRGVWAHRDLPETRESRLAAVRLLLGPGSFICGPTSSWIHGSDVIHPRAKDVWLGRLPGQRLRSRPGCVVQQVDVDPSDLMTIDGALITTPLRTAYDCARWLPLVEGVVVADAFTHAGRFSLEELAAYVESHRGVRGVRRAARVVELVDPASESQMESRVRVLLILEGLAPTHSQYEIRDERDRFVARADFAYPAHKLVVEYDGAQHWKQRRADDRRRDAMRRLGWTVIVVSAEDYFQMPWTIVAQVREALAGAA